MTIFCPSCGTANRDDAETCSECGAIIPKSSANQNTRPSSIPGDFGIVESYPPPPPPSKNPPPPPPEQAFGIEVAPPPPTNNQSYAPYSPAYAPRTQKRVCERCGTVLHPDETQCPGCGKPYQTSLASSSTPSAPYQPPPSYTPRKPVAPPPRKVPPPPPQTKSPSAPVSKTNVAKCARCGAIVYDYETRCSNCGRILAPPTRKSKGKPSPAGRSPPGTARCGRCNAIVYPHQTVCPNCGKPLAPVATTPLEPSQRISRCKRCGHIVYPTDTVCPNCGRKLDPI